MMMPWLLKNEGYPPAVVVAVLLHAILLYVIFEREMSPDEFVRIEPPAMVVASTVQANPQRVNQQKNEQARRQEQRRAEEARRQEQRRVQEQQRVASELAAKQEADRKQAAAVRKQEEDRRAAEDQKKRDEAAQAERDRQERLKQEQLAKEQQEAEAQAAAAASAAQAQALTEEQQLVAQYSELMKRQISRQWSRPNSARNGMLAVLEIRLVPTGEVISSRVVQSSGDAAYDRSIQVAIEKVESFPELQDVPTGIFNRYFRTVTIGFKSEDLLR